MNILVLDTETTGINSKTDKVIEIAGVLIDIPASAFIASYGTLLNNDSNPAEHVNKITVEALANGFSKAFYLEPIVKMMQAADVIIAHNAAFDKPFVDKLLAEHGFSVEKPWVCSVHNLKFPHEYRAQHISASAKFCRKLSHLASDYSISAAGAHRAMQDVQILGNLILMIDKTGPWSLEEQVKNTLAPKVWYMGIVEKPWLDEGKSKDIAKALGFRFEATNKRWLKEMTESEASKILNSSDPQNPFQIVKLAEGDVPTFD